MAERGVSVISLTDSAFSRRSPRHRKIWFELVEADHARGSVP